MGLSDEHELRRFVEAVALGEIADQAFAEECERRGLCPRACVRAPLDWLSYQTGEMN